MTRKKKIYFYPRVGFEPGTSITWTTAYRTYYIGHLGLTAVFELPGGWGVEPPYLTLPTPLPLVKIRPGGVEFQPPHLSFAEVGMLLDSHFLLMQLLKYLGLHHDDLNVTTSWFILQTRVVLSRIVRKIFIKNLNL